jgi:hypothetical protein
MMLEGVRMRKVILGSKLHAVPRSKFNADLIEGVVMGATDDQE